MARFPRLFHGSRGWAGAAALLVAGMTLGCRGGATPAAAPGVQPSYNKTSGRLERIAYDRNQDGKPDAWLNMQGTHVVSAELDDTFDGVVDRREFYANGPAAPVATATAASTLPPRSELVRAEQCTRGNGTMNRVEVYEHGRLARVEEDTNGDGRVDKWETWTDGSLRVLALDTKGTGVPNRRIVYPTDGSSPRMEVDTRGDGTFTPVAQ
jgi:hypothetical protein